MCAVQISPEWYTAACRDLEKIEAHASEYDCPEEGCYPPSQEVFASVKSFFDYLRKSDEKLEEPRIFVANSGDILLTYGGDDRCMDIRFDPTLSFFFQYQDQPPLAGCADADVAGLLSKYFRV